MDASGRWKKEGSKWLLRGRAMRERARERVRPPRQPEGPGSEPRQQHGVSGFGVRQCRHRERGWGGFRHARRRPSRESHYYSASACQESLLCTRYSQYHNTFSNGYAYGPRPTGESPTKPPRTHSPQEELPVLEALINIRNRLTALKKVGRLARCQLSDSCLCRRTPRDLSAPQMLCPFTTRS